MAALEFKVEMRVAVAPDAEVQAEVERAFRYRMVLAGARDAKLEWSEPITMTDSETGEKRTLVVLTGSGTAIIPTIVTADGPRAVQEARS